MLALHGISHDAWDRYTDRGDWHYDVLAHGFKYNLSDIQAALGIHQLRKLDWFIERRALYAAVYRRAFADLEEVELPPDNPRCRHAWHLYILRLNLHTLEIDRAEFIRRLQQKGIGASVHFIPIPLLRFFSRLPLAQYECPRALELYPRIVSLAVVSGDDRRAGPLCGAECPRDLAERQTSETAGAGHAAGDPAGVRPGIGQHGEVHMKPNRNIDVWLERACHLVVVACR